MSYIPQIVEALNRIQQVYIKVPAIHKRYGLIRERAFCYEFYHQMRSTMLMEDEVLINGEIDKSGYPLFRRQNPDFVFHKPGSNDYNAVACEVKGDLRKEGVEKDLRTLSYLLQNGLYKAGVLVIYGVNQHKFLLLRKPQILDVLDVEILAKIWLICLPESGLCEEPVNLYEACNNL